MSDNYDIIVDIDATPAEARSLAKKVRSHIASLRRNQDRIDKQSGGFAWPMVFDPALVTPARVSTDLPEVPRVVTKRRVSFSAFHELACSVCGRTFEPEGPAHSTAVDAWSNGDDNAPYACPFCNASRPLREWDGPFPWGYGYLAFEFVGSSELTPEFVSSIAAILGHRVRLVHYHL